MSSKKCIGVLTVVFIFILLFFGCDLKDNNTLETKGDHAYKQKLYKSATKFWKKAIDKHPNNALLYEKIGKAFLKLSNIDLAEKFLNQSVQIDPEKSDIQKELIKILMIKGDSAGALKKMREFGNLFDKDPDYYILRGDFYMISGNFQKAELSYRKAMLMSDESIRASIKLALSLKASENSSEAENIIVKVIQEQITEPLNLLLLSDYYFLSNSLKKAEDCILNAIKRSPESQIFYIRLAQFYLQATMREKALKTLLILEEKYPDNIRFKLMLADFYLTNMQICQAEKMLNKLKSIIGEDLKTNYNLLMGKCFLYKHQIPYAVSYLKTATNEQPLLLSARYLLGIAYFAGGQLKLAEKSFVSALMLDPHNIDTLVLLSYLHYKNQEYDLCLQYIERVFAIEKANSRALIARGLCLLGQDKYNEAATVFLSALSIDKSVSALYFYGLSIEKCGGYQRAAEIFEEILTIDPALINVLEQYSSLLLKLDQTDKAIELAEQILKQHEDNTELQYVAGDIYFKLGQYEISQTIFEDTLREQNPQGHVYSLLATAYQKTDKIDKAVDLLKSCTIQNPLYVQGWIDLTSLYLKQGHKMMALDTMRTAYKKVPDSPVIAGNLAWLFLETGTEINMALDLSRKAYENAPENASIADTLGWAYYHKGTYSQAEWMFDKAEQSAPEKGIIKYHKAMLFYGQGKIFHAKESFEEALKDKNLEDTIVNHIHKMLAKIEKESSVLK
jgi:tetratricopeptide (TPR) repeat protein